MRGTHGMLGHGVLVLAAGLAGGCVEQEQPAPSSDGWTTIYRTDFASESIHPFEFHPKKIKDWEFYPDHPCVQARVENGMLITTTIPLQNCWIEGLKKNLLTNWSDVAVATHRAEHMFPHPRIRMTARFRFPSKDMDDEYYFHMNPEIFTDAEHGNYNLFAQLRVSNRGNVIHIGENDREMFLDRITVEPDAWHTATLEVDMQKRAYVSASVDGDEWHGDDFKSGFTLREDNGMDEFRPLMGFWVGANLPWGSTAAGGRDVQVDTFKVEIQR